MFRRWRTSREPGGTQAGCLEEGPEASQGCGRAGWRDTFPGDREGWPQQADCCRGAVVWQGLRFHGQETRGPARPQHCARCGLVTLASVRLSRGARGDVAEGAEVRFCTVLSDYRRWWVVRVCRARGRRGSEKKRTRRPHRCPEGSGARGHHHREDSGPPRHSPGQTERLAAWAAAGERVRLSSLPPRAETGQPQGRRATWHGHLSSPSRLPPLTAKALALLAG